MSDADGDRSPLISGSIGEALRALGFAATHKNKGTDIRFHVRIASGKTWRSQFLVSEQQRVVRLYVFLTDDLYPASGIWWVRELVARTNDDVAVLGSFGMDWESGAAYYRTALDLRRRRASVGVFSDLLNGLAFPLAVWERAFSQVTNHAVSPGKALEGALTEAPHLKLV